MREPTTTILRTPVCRQCIVHKYQAKQREWSSSWIEHAASDVRRRHSWTGGPYDGIVTLNSSKPFQFSRPVNGNNFDAQRITEHEIDEVIGLGSRFGITATIFVLRISSVGHLLVTEISLLLERVTSQSTAG